MNTKHGFTLIELLVVIAIIAILAAILFPVFAKVREKARQTSCASNERQLALGVIQYVQDYDEKFPAVWDTNRTPQMNWGQEVYPYIKSLQVFVCPSNVLAAGNVTANHFMGNGFGDESPPSNIPISYAMNGDIGFRNAGEFDYGPYKMLAGINEPTSKIMIVESYSTNAASHWPNWFQCNSGACTTSNYTQSTIYGTLFAGHTGFMNVAYIDGHVKAIQPVNMVTPTGQFGMIGYPGDYGATTDQNCLVNPTDPVGGTLAINCDATNSSIVNAMAGLSTKFN